MTIKTKTIKPMGQWFHGGLMTRLEPPYVKYACADLSIERNTLLRLKGVYSDGDDGEYKFMIEDYCITQWLPNEKKALISPDHVTIRNTAMNKVERAYYRVRDKEGNPTLAMRGELQFVPTIKPVDYASLTMENTYGVLLEIVRMVFFGDIAHDRHPLTVVHEYFTQFPQDLVPFAPDLDIRHKALKILFVSCCDYQQLHYPSRITLRRLQSVLAMLLDGGLDSYREWQEKLDM